MRGLHEFALDVDEAVRIAAEYIKKDLNSTILSRLSEVTADA